MRFDASSHHARAWKYYEVRPSSKSKKPATTDGRYCVWDEPHGDYLYTDAWVKKLVKDLAVPEHFSAVVGHLPEKL